MAADGTVIGELAEAMAPGEWRELQTNGAHAAFSAQDSIFEYCDKLIWDPVNKQILFYGSSDPAGSSDRKFVRYSAATNSWDILPTPSFAGGINHSYKHHAADLQARRLYYRVMGTNARQFWSISLDNVAGAWTRETSISGLEYIDGAVALDFFRARGTVVLHSGASGNNRSGLTEFNPSTGRWSTINDSLSPVGSLHALIECSPVHDLCILGGGDVTNNLWRLLPDGSVVNLGSGTPIRELDVRFANTTADPVSGHFLIMSRDDEFYEFNATVGSSGRWTLIDRGTSVPPFNGYTSNDSTFHMSSSPVSNYGVVLYVQWRATGSKVWLYKHAASTIDTVAPAPVTELMAE
jgi:hypothetical protein